MIKINIHSLIDVITNSSTEIFINSHTNTIQYFKELIEDLMKCMDVEGKAEDYFEFKLKENKYSRDNNSMDLIVKPKKYNKMTFNITKEIDKMFYMKEVEC